MRFYEQPQRVGENRLPPRSYYIPENENGYRTLNGQWDFAFFARDFDETPVRTGTIDVPSCWQCRGYEAPWYSNHVYPFPVDPPYVPAENPMGVYTRRFDIDDLSRRYYIVFEGVDSCVELLINDAYAGFSQGSRLQAEFDVTPFLREGSNTVTAKVRKWCFGSYLEDQDCFRYNGIFRDVYLLSRPEGHLRDIDIHAKDGVIRADFTGSAHVRLFSPDGALLDEQDAQNGAVFQVEQPMLWNAEQPRLYTLEFIDRDEIIRQQVGFVTYGINERHAFTVNGVEVKLKGVNHHDTHPTNGYTQTDAEILQDLRLMKKLNMNCIRTSHYPPTPKFLQFCNELGFYVMLETDIETHGFCDRYPQAQSRGYDCYDDNPEWIGNLPEWQDAYMDRMQRAYERDKNNPCIFSWSVGNESGFCKVHETMVAYLRRIDPRRLAHCENASRATEEWGPRGAALYGQSDLYSRMYPTLESVQAYAEDESRPLPYFFCEYAHAMGNGPGDIGDYWKLIWEHPKLIGGCIWEWADHTFLVNGVPMYGGDFGELTSDSNFCVDGLVTYDRRCKAGTLNAKYVYQNVRFALDGSTLRITNLFDFRSLDGFSFRVDIRVDGKTVQTIPFTLSIGPKETAAVSLPLPEACRMGAFAVCRMLDADGDPAALAQLPLPVPVLPAEPVCDDSDVQIIESAAAFEIRSAEAVFTFCRQTGQLTSIQKGGRTLLPEPMRLGAWRAPIDNERKIWHLWGHANSLGGENLDRCIRTVRSVRREGSRITVEAALAGIGRVPFLRYTETYSFLSGGRVRLSLAAKVRENCMWLPRLGYELTLPQYSDRFTYYGRGPMENYCDMNLHTTTGVFESTAAAEYWPYPKPQDHGNHTGCRFLQLENGLRFEADNFECCVSQFSTQMLSAAAHTSDLQPDGRLHVRIDYACSGVGSHSCGPELAEQYRLSQKDISFTFDIIA